MKHSNLLGQQKQAVEDLLLNAKNHFSKSKKYRYL